MSLLHSIGMMRQMDRLIRTKSTGGQKEFATKMGVHRSTLNEYLNEMKELGFPIRFCTKKHTYYYEEEGKLVSKFFECALSNEDMQKIYGGKSLLLNFLNFDSV